MTIRGRPAAAAIAAGFLALHLPFLPASLDDSESVRLALELHGRANPSPGHPVFVAVARLARSVARSDARAMALFGAIAAALGVLALFELFGKLERIGSGPTRRSAGGPTQGSAPADPPSMPGPESWTAWAAALLAATSPLYWFTAARPLADATVLAAAVGVQAWTLAARSPVSFAAAAFAAGLASGLGGPVGWLTVPLLLLGAHRREHEDTKARKTAIVRLRVFVSSCLSPFAIGALVWAVPLLVAGRSGSTVWRTIADARDLRPIWAHAGAADALYELFVGPWALTSTAAVVLVFAALGAALTFRFRRPSAVALAVAYGPYAVVALLLPRATPVTLPLVVPAAYLVVRGAAAFGWRPGLAVAIALSVLDAHVGGTSIAAYASEPAPAFRLLDDMARTAEPTPPVLAMDRREQRDLRLPFEWYGDRMPATALRLPSPRGREWLGVVNYWNGGGRDPVWYVADPRRMDVDLVQHGEPARYRWSVPYPILLAGAEPGGMDWYRIVRPWWYVAEGWDLTPEARDLSQALGIGLARGSIHGWVERSAASGAMAIGGRNAGPPTRLTMSIGSSVRETVAVGSGAFLETARLPRSTDAGPDYLPVTVRADPPAPVSVEQFSVAPAPHVVYGFGAGWSELEYDPRTGRRWRWLSERGELHILGYGRPIRLHLEGESPGRYFAKPSHLVVRVGPRVAFDERIDNDFSFDVTVPGQLVDPWGRTIVTIDTDQVFVPAERNARSRDRRHLGLRIFRCEVEDLGE